jgi:hypothetical protein
MMKSPGVSPHGEERALARVSNHERAAILRDTAKRPLLRMRNNLDGAILPWWLDIRNGIFPSFQDIG